MLIYLVRQAARDLLAPAAAYVVERLGGEPAGTFDKIVEQAAFLIETTSGLMADLDAVKGERDAARDQLTAEREKSAKGLVCIQDAIRKTETLTKERDEARARVKELEGSAEPFCWACIGTNGMMHSTHASEADAAKYRHGTDVVEALYRHPLKPTSGPVTWNSEAHSWGIDDREGGTRHFTHQSDALVAARQSNSGDPFPLYRHPPKAAGEPVAWRWVANGETVLRFLPASPEWAGVEALTPLYEAPPPAAYGVETKTFAVVYGREFADLTPCEVDLVHVGSRQLAEEQADLGTLVRIIPADAPVVDVAAIRKAIEHLVDIHAYGAVGTLRAAIGDKAGA